MWSVVEKPYEWLSPTTSVTNWTLSCMCVKAYLLFHKHKINQPYKDQWVSIDSLYIIIKIVFQKIIIWYTWKKYEYLVF